MARLNLTLDDDTFNRLERHAKLQHLARDYAQGREDAESLLADIEAGQLELLNA